MQYLVNSGKVTEAELFGFHPLDGTEGFDAQTVGRKFMRINAGFDAYIAHFSHYQTAVQRALTEKTIVLPIYFYDAAVRAGLHVPDRRPPGSPRFIDFMEIPELTGTLEQMKPIIERFCGCWRFYRLSSRATGKVTHINVGFLNIKPYDFLKQNGLPSAQFSLYQRSEEMPDAGQPSIISKIEGLMVHTSEHVTLIGERTKSGGVGMSYVGHISWRHVNSGSPQRPTVLRGVSSIPNSEGQNVIGAYFCAALIDGSDKNDEKTYQDIKAAETDESNSGSIEWPALRNKIKDAALQKAIDSMIERSKFDVVLKA